MNAADLRIGNWLIDGNGNYYQVEVADLALLSTRPDTKECNPIPLTPEVLEACGMEKLNNAWIIDDGSRNDHGDKICGDKTFSLFDNSYGKCENLTYAYEKILNLHQLQNLYFALTGTELIYNPRP